MKAANCNTAEISARNLSIPEFADLEGVSVPTIWREIAAGRLVAIKIGRRTLITPEHRSQWKAKLPRSNAKVAA